MGVSNIIALISGVALFLYGMLLMGDSLKKVAGSKLELILYRLSSTPLKGVLLGTGVTAVIQSSSATSVMVVGFVNSGMMKLRQAIGVILGAIIGTSVTGWIIALGSIESGSGIADILSTSNLTGIVVVVGIILSMFSKRQSNKNLGGIFMGFGILMFGLSAMSGAVAPLRESREFIRIMTAFTNPFIAILAGAVMASVIQSASAAVGIVQALAITGAVDFQMALPLVMGISIGASVPVLLASAGSSTEAKRTAFVYLYSNVIGAVFFALLFYGANALFDFAFAERAMTAVSIAAMNTAYRVVNVGLLMPFCGLIEKTMRRIIPDDPGEKLEMADIERLEDRFIGHPALAIEQSRAAICSMAHKAEKNLLAAIKLLTDFSDDGFDSVQARENVIDKYEDKLGTYLVKITQHELNHNQNIEVSKFLHTISDFERIADHAVNISYAAQEMHEKKIEFSFVGGGELDVLISAVREIVSVSVKAFTEGSVETAYRVEPLEELMDDLCDEVKLHHIQRLQKGTCTLEHGFVFNDLLTNIERIADHCSNIAVAMIELDADSFDTHEYLNSLKQAKTTAFKQYYDEYSGRFA
ncbi:MAG: Na/Pi cotransporter family protein, partial [Oscillospiraceae bacterium]|nr:Na/Pi cotransporter family protein [Oscillospiraceae bacterium]